MFFMMVNNHDATRNPFVQFTLLQPNVAFPIQDNNTCSRTALLNNTRYSYFEVAPALLFKKRGNADHEKSLQFIYSESPLKMEQQFYVLLFARKFALPLKKEDIAGKMAIGFLHLNFIVYPVFYRNLIFSVEALFFSSDHEAISFFALK